MLELLIILALGGSVIAGIWDLFTTEVPDEVPALMIVLGISLLFVQSAASGDFTPFLLSLLMGTVLLAVGLAIYQKGGWGGADAWILAAIGYMIPLYNGRIFMLDYLPNFLIISAIYMIIYAIILGLRNTKLFSLFAAELKSRIKIVIGVPVAFAIIMFASALYLSPATLNITFQVILPFLLILALSMFWVYAKTIEKFEFKKRIPVSKLKVGDVLEEMLWVGITEEQLAKIRKEKKFVTIKEGVRFVPVFPITLVITLLFGSLFFTLPL